MAVFSLAETLHMPVERLMDEIGTREFFGWMRYFEMKMKAQKGPEDSKDPVSLIQSYL